MMGYAHLPIRMSEEELRPYFLQILSSEDRTEPERVMEYLMRLNDLIDRHVFNNVPLAVDLYIKISEYLMAVVDYASYDNVEAVTTIVANLQMKDVYQAMCNRLPDLENRDIVSLILDAASDVNTN